MNLEIHTKMKRSTKYWNDIAGYLAREMNTEQIEKFLLKTKDNQQLKNDYELMKKTWNSFDSNPADKYQDSTAAWEKLDKRIEAEGLNPGDVPVIRMRPVNYFVRIAAIVLLILAVGIPAVYYSVNQTGERGIISHKAEDGILTVDLPDGSRIFLNEGSSIEYRKSYEENRSLELDGEGFFNVMEDQKRPFMVNAGKVVVTVLGTSFNIRENPGDEVEVFVESGKVKVAMSGGEETLVLLPGQLAEAKDALNNVAMKDANYLAWKTKEFKFVDEPLEKIFDVLEAAYHVDLITEEAEISDLRLTTTYSKQSIDAILNTICTALNLNFTKEGKVYILQSN